MAGRERKIPLKVMVTEDEARRITEKMQSIDSTNFSNYARLMLLNGKIIKHDFSTLKDLVHEIGAIGKNINQIAKRANESHSIYEKDVLLLREEFFKLKAKVSERLVKIIRKG